MNRCIIGVAIVALGAASIATGTAAADDDDEYVTAGRFVTLEPGYDIRGHAVMERDDDGTTVRVRVRGLAANRSYPTHVHNLPCASSPFPGGGHYQHVVGPRPGEEMADYVNPINEIWPIVSTNPAGVGKGNATHEHVARPEAQSIVIHDPDNTKIRLACVDLLPVDDDSDD